MLASTPEQVAVTGTSAPGFPPSNNSTFLDSEFRYVLLPVVYGIVFILGLFANIYVLFVLRCLRDAKAMGEIRIYMTNLTIADLLFVCALPFWIGYYSRNGNWVYTDFMCRLTGTLFFINTYCSILFLGAISVNRYWAVTRPLDAASSDHRRRGIIVCVVIWVLTMSMAIPYLISPGTKTDENDVIRCFEGYQNETDSQKKTVAATHFAIIGMFFVVFFLVVVCNFLIARALLLQNPPQSEFRSTTIMSRKSNNTMSSSFRRPRGVKRRALQMLWAVVGVFVLCFLPHHVIQGPWTLAVLQISQGWGHVEWDQKTLQLLNDAHQITLCLMGLNCILDPVVYCFATRKFRRFIMAHIKKLGKGDGCSHTVTSQLSMDSRNHSQRLQSEHQEPEMD
ncbi:platelet-activating factor receptor isoform X1 [Dicentrarchus labrax]|uniref:Platelet-activating factor receptor n=1 Tax=Dicentrarchus labrax TaxID=13489 RepID=A0A8P4G2I3_DICLA|nr:platelet-activating factor receptor isoform X1 [Dicentrarchus labrax]XP_051241755.1 platelet-activating factor receptor isoform X1 [Dicentrarchus labrax]